MIYKLFKVAAVIHLWRLAKPYARTVIALIVVLLLNGYLHDEYLAYSQLTAKQQYIGLSFTIKWLVIMLTLLTSSVCLRRIYKKISTVGKAKESNMDEEFSDQSRERTKRIKSDFDFLLDKDKLTSRSKKIMNKCFP